LVGTLVFIKNPSSIVNRVYGLLTLCLLSYPVFNHFSLQTDDRLLLIRFVLFFATLSVTLQYILVWLLASSKSSLGRLQWRVLYLSIVVALLDMTPLVFSGLTDADNPVPIPHIAAPLFILHFVVVTGLAVGKLLKSYRSSTGLKRNQLMILLIG